MFDIQPPKQDMVSDWLGSSTSKYGFDLPANTDSMDPFRGTSLSQSYTNSITSNLPDYSSIFNQAARGGSIFDRAASGSLISGTPGGGGSGSRGGSRPSGARQVSGGAYVMPGAPPPLDFYLGPAPTLKDLNLNYEEMGKRAMEANKPYAEQYKQFAPQTEAGARALSQAGATYATGQLSRDMASQIGRGAAALGFSTGLGGRSGIGRNILSRDLGLGSLQVQQQGADLLAKSSALAQQAMQAMNPISPNEVFSTAANQASINQQIANQNLMNAWQTQGLPGQFDVTKGQYVGYQPGTYSTTKPLTPDLEASSALNNRAADLNSRSPGRFRVSGGKILDSYSGKFV
jgi:hypothetical protein